jgi:hypothetical protein
MHAIQLIRRTKETIVDKWIAQYEETSLARVSVVERSFDDMLRRGIDLGVSAREHSSIGAAEIMRAISERALNWGERDIDCFQ